MYSFFKYQYYYLLFLVHETFSFNEIWSSKLDIKERYLYDLLLNTYKTTILGTKQNTISFFTDIENFLLNSIQFNFSFKQFCTISYERVLCKKIFLFKKKALNQFDKKTIYYSFINFSILFVEPVITLAK